MPGTAPPQFLIEADEAYPAFERLVLGAEKEVVLGFRIFDPSTRLRSQEARAVGETWRDLIEHVLRRGVDVELYLADFDPLGATRLHEGTWKTVDALRPIKARLPEGAGRLTVRPRLHPARLGLLPHMLFWPLIRFRLWQLRRHGEKPRERRRLPRLRAMLSRATAVTAYPASHHQKIAAIDGRWLYIGGLDLDERRYDDHTHDQPAQQTWHDVQTLLDDPARAEEAAAHLRSFGPITAGKVAPDPAPHLLRTLSRKRSRPNIWHMSPKPLMTEILDRHIALIERSERLIYLESQFFRDRDIAEALARRAAEVPDLRLVLLLPGAPDSVAFQNRPSLDGRFGDHLQCVCIDRVLDAFGPSCLVASPVQQRSTKPEDEGSDRLSLHGAPLIYVHAKVSIFDDHAAIISSANLNGRSLKWDTEAGVEFDQPEDIARLRSRLHAHWWTGGQGDENAPPLERFFETWRSGMIANAERPPEDRHGFLVPYDQTAARATAVPIPGAPAEMV